jgi:hypothetical protein
MIGIPSPNEDCQFVFFTPYQPNCNVCPVNALPLFVFPSKNITGCKAITRKKKQDARTADVVPGDENSTFTF